MQIHRKRKRQLDLHIKPNLTKRKLQSELPIDEPDRKRAAARAANIAQPGAQPDKKRVAVRAAYTAQCAKRKALRHTTRLVAVLG